MRRLVALVGLFCSTLVFLTAGLIQNSFLLEKTQWQRENNFINQTNYVRESTNPEKSFPTDDGKVRILAIGDSFVWGDGVANMDETWPRALEAKLNRAVGRDLFQVIAIGQSGAATFNEVAWLKQGSLISDNDIDAVVLGYVTNDPVPPGSKSGVCDGYWCFGIRQAEEQPDYQQCRAGLSGVTPILLRGLALLAPPLAQDLDSKYCYGLYKGGASDSTGYFYIEWLQRIIQPDSLDIYRATVKNLAVALGATPAFVLKTPESSDAVDGATKPVAILGEAGLDVVPNPKTTTLVKTTSPAELGVNPVNWHPGLDLVNAYTDDLVATLITDPRIVDAMNTATAPIDEQQKVLVTNSIPRTDSSRNADGSLTISYSGEDVLGPGATLNWLGYSYPEQQSLCMKNGKPYALIGLEPIDGSVSLDITNGITTDWSIRAIPGFGSAAPLTVTTTQKSWTISGGVVRGIELMNNAVSGCDLSQRISVPGFTLTVKVGE